MPLKTETPMYNHWGQPYKSYHQVKVRGHVNKGRDKDWYKARLKKYQEEHYPNTVLEINWS